MKGTCQTCGATGPLEWFAAEALGRQTTAVMLELPKGVQDQVLQYLALFRPATGRGLAPKKALRLVTEIRDLIKAGYVSRKGRPDRSCPPQIWAAAMEVMVNQRDGLSLPMPNHNYLKKIAWDHADQADADRERSQVEDERSGNVQRGHHEDDQVGKVDFSSLTREEVDRLPPSVRKKHGV